MFKVLVIKRTPQVINENKNLKGLPLWNGKWQKNCHQGVKPGSRVLQQVVAKTNNDYSPNHHKTTVYCTMKVINEIITTVIEPTTWPYQKTMLLLETYREHVDSFSNPCLKKKDVWQRLSSAINQKGYKTTSDSCDKKWRALVYRYIFQ